MSFHQLEEEAALEKGINYLFPILQSNKADVYLLELCVILWGQPSE